MMWDEPSYQLSLWESKLSLHHKQLMQSGNSLPSPHWRVSWNQESSQNKHRNVFYNNIRRFGCFVISLTAFSWKGPWHIDHKTTDRIIGFLLDYFQQAVVWSLLLPASSKNCLWFMHINKQLMLLENPELLTTNPMKTCNIRTSTDPMCFIGYTSSK